MRVEERRARLALAVRAELGESPVWDVRRQELYFVDILGQKVHAYRPADMSHRFFDTRRPVGAVVLREDGGLLLAAADAFFLAEADGSALEPFGTFRVADERVRFNDAKVDPAGCLLAGTMHWEGREAVGALYRLHGDASTEVLLEPVTISNGIAFSADGSTLYYIDTPTNSVDSFVLEPGTGRLGARQVVAEVDGGSPDGMAIDDEGMLWVAIFDGGRVERIDPRGGDTIGVVRVPTPQVTSVAFGGPSLTDLYITTAHENYDAAAIEADPLAGDLFVVDAGVSGPPPHRFRVAGTH